MLDDRSYMRTPSSGSRQPLTVTLLIINAVCFLFQLLFESSGRDVTYYFGLSAQTLLHGYVWQLVTYMFLHGGIVHILLNSLGLYYFGRAVEETVGRANFLKIYLGTGIMGGIAHVAGNYLLSAHFNSAVIGASAGVCGLMAAFAMLFPHRQITMLLFFVLPVTLSAWVLVAGTAIYSIFGIIKPFDNTAQGAHLGGILAGLAYVKWILHANWSWPEWKRVKPARPSRELVKASTSGSSSWKRAQSPPFAEDLPPAEFISREVDPILDKISAHGIQSLTDRERKILEAARAKMSKR